MKYTTDELHTAVKKSFTYSEILRNLGLRISGSAYKKIKQEIEKYSLDTSHLLGQAFRKGKGRTTGSFKATPLDEVLVENRYCNSNHLKNRLIKEGIKEARCENCKLDTWLGQPIGLQLDHINGKHDDNRLDNLKLCCPNCHYQTLTWGNKKNMAVSSIG